MDDQTVFWLVVKKLQAPTFIEHNTCDSAWAQEQVKAYKQAHPHSSNHSSHVHHPVNGTIIACPLDYCLFSAGALKNEQTELALRSTFKKRGDEPVVLHVNYVNGHESKRLIMERSHLWISYDSNWTCAPLKKWY